MQEMMDSMDIAFPNLGIYLENVPKSFQVFGLEIAFYGVIIGIGMMAGLAMAVKSAKLTGQNTDLWWDAFVWEIIFAVIGARVYYVIFNFEIYRNDLWSIFNIREGGGAIYGSVIAALLTLFVYTRKKQQSFLAMADTGVTGLILGQAIGRWGNFTNREVFGSYTDNLLAMRLPIGAVRSWDITEELWAHVAEGTNYIQVHPTFLYESLWNLAVLAMLLLYQKHKKFTGEIFLFYLGGYGLGRVWIEHIRTDRLLIPGTALAVSEVLALCCVIASVGIDLAVRRHLKKKADILPESNS